MSDSLSRRTVLTAAAALPLARFASASPLVLDEAQTDVGGPFTLPPLPYRPDALRRAIDRETMLIHHGRHHATYVRNLNAAIKKAPAEWQTKPIEELLANLSALPAEIRDAVRNHGGGHDNHSIFWSIMSPNGGGVPTGRIAEIVERQFGGLDAFKVKFNDLGEKRFGSGWVWLAFDGSKYDLVSRPNQDSPRMDGLIPIMGNDVWEHAYYLRYQNKRADYLKAWWNVVNWREINERIRLAETAG